MLALATGWTPDVIAELPTAFRAACHWTLFVRAIVGEEGLQSVDVPRGASREQRMAAQAARVDLLRVRSAVYPDD